MAIELLCRKLGMTRVFDEEAGSMIPVTVIDVADGAPSRGPSRVPLHSLSKS